MPTKNDTLPTNGAFNFKNYTTTATVIPLPKHQTTKTNATGLSLSSSLLLDPSTKFFVYKLSDSGLGSQLLKFYLKVIFFKQQYNRHPIILESDYGYRRNASRGVLSGYFSSHHAVVINDNAILQPFFPEINLTAWTTQPQRRLPDHLLLEQRERKQQSNDQMILVGSLEYRGVIVRTLNLTSDELYTRMVEHMCPDLQFNRQTIEEIQQVLESNQMLEAVTMSHNENRATVAFHIRRGDKILSPKEGKKYSAKKYVEKLKEIIMQNNEKGTCVKIEQCFLATDEPEAVFPELTEALQEDNELVSLLANTTCHYVRIAPTPTLHFFTELYIMIHANYFVGTFSSNVGGLVGVLRSCYGSLPHYGNSYAVDSTHWFLR